MSSWRTELPGPRRTGVSLVISYLDIAIRFGMLHQREGRGPTRKGQGGGGQILSDGTRPEPGGWNRIQLTVSDLTAEVQRLEQAGAHLRSEIVKGVGGDQVLVEDPSGNPIELFQPAPPDADA